MVNPKRNTLNKQFSKMMFVSESITKAVPTTPWKELSYFREFPENTQAII